MCNNLRKSAAGLRVFYACGTDLANKCRLWGGMPGCMGEVGVVVVPRTGEPPKADEQPAKRVFIASPAEGDRSSG